MGSVLSLCEKPYHERDESAWAQCLCCYRTFMRDETSESCFGGGIAGCPCLKKICGPKNSAHIEEIHVQPWCYPSRQMCEPEAWCVASTSTSAICTCSGAEAA